MCVNTLFELFACLCPIEKKRPLFPAASGVCPAPRAFEGAACNGSSRDDASRSGGRNEGGMFGQTEVGRETHFQVNECPLSPSSRAPSRASTSPCRAGHHPILGPAGPCNPCMRLSTCLANGTKFFSAWAASSSAFSRNLATSSLLAKK